MNINSVTRDCLSLTTYANIFREGRICNFQLFMSVNFTYANL